MIKYTLIKRKNLVNLRKFYERYWEPGQKSPPELCGWISEAKEKLRKLAHKFQYGSLILDAGCGSGIYSRYLKELGLEVVGIDISFNAIHKAKKDIPGCQFLQASLEFYLPFKNNSFSLIFCSEVLEHIFDIHFVLSEFNRILELNGLFILTVPYHGLIKNIIISFRNYEEHYNPYISHIRFFTIKSLKVCLERSGFKMISYSGLGRCWPIWKSVFVVASKVSLPTDPPKIIR